MHKYQEIYEQCENTIGYDDMIERVDADNPNLLPRYLAENCKMRIYTLFSAKAYDVYSELFDFLDGNGFIIESVMPGIFRITPVIKEKGSVSK
jgi:hypothetical protein